MTVNVDKFIQGTLKRGVPGNYLAVVSTYAEETKLRDLLWKEIQKIAEDGNHVIEEIDYYQGQYERDMDKLRRLDTDPKAIVEIAREHYFMKNEDEDIFVLRDGSSSKTKEYDETTE